MVKQHISFGDETEDAVERLLNDAVTAVDSKVDSRPSAKRKRAVDFFDDHKVEPSHTRPARDAITLARRALPIAQHEELVCSTVRHNNVVILVGETGSGKSTQVPQFLLRDYEGAIAVTQPRRVAAINLARRVADEMDVELGGQVGYSVRFDDRTSKATRLKYLTDGMLLIELLKDPMLSNYSVVVLDEAHERSLVTDLLLGFMKALLRKRIGLRLVVMSATLDADSFSRFFDDAEILQIPGRMFDVQLMYTAAPLEDYADAVLKTIFQVHLGEPTGDLLVFLTGSDEIERLVTLCEMYARQLPKGALRMLPLPLYAALTQQQQQRVFEPTPKGTRKIILSTNIAETSVTVPGVRYVIDCGLQKQKSYHSKVGFEELKIVPLARSNADQRAGRAGREAPGKCWRLYTEETYARLPSVGVPEIRRVGLAQSVLWLKVRGVDDVLGFDFLDPPSRDAVIRAMEQLYALGALDDSGKVTSIGREMSTFPLEPRLARVLNAATGEDCVDAVIDIISALSVDGLFVDRADQREAVAEARKRFESIHGDHITYLNVIRAYVAVEGEARRGEWARDNQLNRRTMKLVADTRDQLQRHVRRVHSPLMSDDGDGDLAERVLRAFLTGFSGSTAFLSPDGSYRTTGGNQAVAPHPSSAMHGRKCEAILFSESILTTRLWVRGVSKVEPSWIRDAAPQWTGRRSTTISS
ncbi:Salivary acidic proline-rich phosphoprotein 1/2 [Savitreella phatthalungensis]